MQTLHDFIYGLQLWFQEARQDSLVLFVLLVAFASLGFYLILKLIRWILWTGFVLTVAWLTVQHFGGPESLASEFWQVVNQWQSNR